MTFVCDAHLGRLARHLRLLGVDAWFDPGYHDDELARIAATGRTLLSRDRLLIARVEAAGHPAHFVVAVPPDAQAREVVRAFGLAAAARPFTRCLVCNGRLREAAPEAVRPRVPPGVPDEYDRFLECPGCGRVYWEGSHYRRMRAFADTLLR